MKEPKDNSMQLLLTALFALCLFIAILLLVSCQTGREAQRTFSKPKYEVETHYTPKNGRSAVRQSWYKRFWFWQKGRTRSTEE